MSERATGRADIAYSSSNSIINEGLPIPEADLAKESILNGKIIEQMTFVSFLYEDALVCLQVLFGFKWVIRGNSKI